MPSPRGRRPYPRSLPSSPVRRRGRCRRDAPSAALEERRGRREARPPLSRCGGRPRCTCAPRRLPLPAREVARGRGGTGGARRESATSCRRPSPRTRGSVDSRDRSAWPRGCRGAASRRRRHRRGAPRPTRRGQGAASQARPPSGGPRPASRVAAPGSDSAAPARCAREHAGPHRVQGGLWRAPSRLPRSRGPARGASGLRMPRLRVAALRADELRSHSQGQPIERVPLQRASIPLPPPRLPQDADGRPPGAIRDRRKRVATPRRVRTRVTTLLLVPQDSPPNPRGDRQLLRLGPGLDPGHLLSSEPDPHGHVLPLLRILPGPSSQPSHRSLFRTFWCPKNGVLGVYGVCHAMGAQATCRGEDP